MKPVTRARIDAALDTCARSLGISAADHRRRTVLRTLASEVLRIQSLDASEPDPRPPVHTPPPFEPPARGDWDEDEDTKPGLHARRRK